MGFVLCRRDGLTREQRASARNPQLTKSQPHWVVIVGSQYHQRDEMSYVLSNYWSLILARSLHGPRLGNGVLGLGHQNARRLLWAHGALSKIRFRVI